MNAPSSFPVRHLACWSLLVAGIRLRAQDVSSLAGEPGGAGGQAVAGDVVAEISTGAAIAGGIVSHADVLVKAGYTGQLFDAVALQVAPAIPAVSEGAPVQFIARMELDDATSLAGNVSAVWSPLSGPLASIDPAGLAVTGLVYEDTTAAVRAAAMGLTGDGMVTILDVNPDNFGAYAGDGIDDDWQVSFFGLDNPNAAPGADPDLDGQTNAFEFDALADPTDPVSLFTAGFVAGPGTVIDYGPVSGERTYTVEYSTNLLPATWLPLNGQATSHGDRIRVTDPAPGARRFYRIRISR